MGIVYRAEDHVLGRVVAIKVLPRGGGADPSSVTRFEREARAPASLFHRNIVSVFDAGEDEMTRFIVMEYVTGVSLARLLADRGRLPLSRAVNIASQIAHGLVAAHAAGIVHRDVKPANVMIDDSETVKLLDFGIAQASTGTALTQTGSVLGSAFYIAPEVACGGAAEERSDVYSLGCVLYEMVTGRPPFTGELDAAVLHQHVHTPPRPPRTRAPEIPRSLDELIMQMLSKQAARRPSAEMLVPALDRVLSARTPRRAPYIRDHGDAERETAALPVHRRPGRRRRTATAVIAATLILAVAGVAAALLVSRNAPLAGQNAAGAAALRHVAHNGRGGREPWPLATTAAAAYRDVARLAGTAVAALEAARAPVPASPPARPKRPARHRAHPAPKHPAAHHGQGAGEPEAPPAEREAEVPAPETPAETQPVQTTPAEPPPASTTGAPAP